MTDGTLNLKLLGAERSGASSDVLGRIESFESGASAAKDVVVPTDGVDVRLAPGTYSVRLFLPGGQILQQACEIGEGALVPVTFREPAAKNFSLQEASGGASLDRVLAEARSARPQSERAPSPITVVPDQPVQLPARVPVPRGVGPGRVRAWSRKLGVPRDTEDFEAFGRRASVPAAPAGADGPARAGAAITIAAIGPSLEMGAVAASAAGADSWALLTTVAPAFEPVRGWQAVDPGSVDGSLAIWRLPPTLFGNQPGPERYWARIRFGASVELLSLPAPWRSANWHMASIDVLVDAKASGRAASSVAVLDPKLDGLLTYLDRGRLGAVRPMLGMLEAHGQINSAIYRKTENPLAACAAAYAGLAMFDASERERWDDWLPNIMRWFPWLPDGGIVHARRILLRPKNPQEVDEALVALRNAYRAGIPYYSVGLQLMRDMLELLSVTHPEAKTMLDAVAPIAARSDPKRLFTVLRYPG